MLGNCHGYPLQQIVSSTTSEFEKASSDTFSSQQYSVSDGLGSVSSSSVSEKSYDYNNYEAEQINSLTSTPDGIMQTTQQQMDQINSNAQLLSQMQQNYDMYPADELLAQQPSLYEITDSEALLAQQERQLYSTTSSDLLQTEMNSEYYTTDLTNGNLDYSDDSDDSDDSSYISYR